MEIALVGLNATYQHTSFGLRYLKANLGSLSEVCEILEFTTDRNPRDIVEKVLSLNPRIVGIGVYIWNTQEVFDVVSLLKKLAPEIKVVLGGPEVSYEGESQALCQLSDLTIQGEGETAFKEVCEKYLSEKTWPENLFLKAALPEVKSLTLPYALYSDHDIQNRYIYVEASRGCPYKCEYCLSSLDKSVRNFPIESFLSDLEVLIQRGARNFKFIDRTFNLSPTISTRILEFFLKHIDLGLFLHFEMVPDRLPDELKVLIEKFPAGALQFEIGIQTWNPEVAALVSRRNDFKKVVENLTYLQEKTKVHAHVDLIVGLPGESIASFAAGFDRLAQIGSHEIQVGMLKRLKGTPIIRHDLKYEMVYQDHPPFQILRTKDVSFSEMQTMARFSKHWDLVGNSGHFVRFIEHLKKDSHSNSFFQSFHKFSEYLFEKFPTSHSISLNNLFQSVYEYLQTMGLASEEAYELVKMDYQRNGRKNLPSFAKIPHDQIMIAKNSSLQKRQRAHQHV